jgi:phosphatidylserine/phosphatidylglycerophosphate/cardiolipin synthase-like enzyme
MVSDVIDNRQIRLAERVRDLLAEGAVAAQFAVGYLFLDGLMPLRTEMARICDVQILIGNVMNRLTEEQIQEEAEARISGDPVGPTEGFAVAVRASHTRAAAVTALNLRRTLEELPRDREHQALLLTLAARIADGGLKVRLFTAGRLHAKLALVQYPDGRRIGIVGSSNLTLGGVAQPTELNVVVREPDSVADLAGWYLGLWDSAQDFHRELFEELTQCWATRPLTAFDGAGGR